MKKNIMNFVLIFLNCAVVANLGTIFRFVCNNLLEAYLWWIATGLSICGVVTLLSVIGKSIREKQFKILLICGIIFTSIGAIMLIVCSFIFIKELSISISLSVVVFLICSAFAIFPFWLKTNSKAKKEDDYLK